MFLAPCHTQEGPYADWEYDPSFLQPRRVPSGPAGGVGSPFWNWHEQLESEGVYMYYWQANATNGGRDVKRQAISFPGAEPQGAASYSASASGCDTSL